MKCKVLYYWNRCVKTNMDIQGLPWFHYLTTTLILITGYRLSCINNFSYYHDYLVEFLTLSNCPFSVMALAADILWRYWYRLDSYYLSREYRSIKHLFPRPCWRLCKNARQEQQKTTEQQTDVSVRNRMFHRKYQTLWTNAKIFTRLDGCTRENWQIKLHEVREVFVINYIGICVYN